MSELAIWRNDKNQSKEEDEDEFVMMVDIGDRFYNDSIFGFSQAIPMNFKAGLQDLLYKFARLERYIDGHEEASYGTKVNCNLEVSLEEALYYPRRISDRIPIIPQYHNQITPANVKYMWCRLVAHYFEYLYGVPEVKQFADPDKKQLVVHHLCKVICFAVAYRTYSANMRRGIILGGGIVFIPSRETDDELVHFMSDLEQAMQQLIVTELRNLQMTEEEYILTKLIALFSETEILHLSPMGHKLCRTSRKRYIFLLQECVISKNPNMTHEQVIGRMQAILNILPQLEMVSEVDDRHLAKLVQRGKVSLKGQLPTEVHVLSKK